MPQKVVARVGLSRDTGGLQPRGNPDACAFSVCDCVNDFAAAIGAVAAREIFWIGGLAGSPVDNDAALLKQDHRTPRFGPLVRSPEPADRPEM